MKDFSQYRPEWAVKHEVNLWAILILVLIWFVAGWGWVPVVATLFSGVAFYREGIVNGRFIPDTPTS